jgi:hypothetical protein
MMEMGWPAAFVIVTVALLAAALINNQWARAHELRKDLTIKAYQAESIEANKELEVQRHKIESLAAALEEAERELITWRTAGERRH